ncbi:MAG: lysophospholipid acyltransferase family protein, partial [Halothiobacillus sp.]
MDKPLNFIQKTTLALATSPLWLIAKLPQAVRLKLGRFVGRQAGKLIKKRRQIMTQNLSLAFPEKNNAWREAIIRQHFERLGEDAAESFWGWYGNTTLPPEHRIIGAEHIETALARGQGIILNAGHFTPG